MADYEVFWNRSDSGSMVVSNNDPDAAADWVHDWLRDAPFDRDSLDIQITKVRVL